MRELKDLPPKKRRQVGRSLPPLMDLIPSSPVSDSTGADFLCDQGQFSVNTMKMLLERQGRAFSGQGNVLTSK